MNFKKILAMFLSIAMILGSMATVSFAEVPADAVAKIGDVYYSSIDAAVNSAADGDTITVLSDCTLAPSTEIDKELNFDGEATLTFANVDGEEIIVKDGASISGNNISGVILAEANATVTVNTPNVALYALGDITFKGENVVNNFSCIYSGTTININVGDSLATTTSSRVVVGHGNTFNIEGNITDAKTADTSAIKPSLLLKGGASFTGNSLNFNVKNAYVVLSESGYSSTKNTLSTGKYILNFENSVVYNHGSLEFGLPQDGYEYLNPEYEVKFKDSVVTTTSHFKFTESDSYVVFDNTDVNKDTATAINNTGTMIIKNGSYVNALAGAYEHGFNSGSLTVDNATYVASGEYVGKNTTSTLNVVNGGTATVSSITNADVNVGTSSSLTSGTIKNTDITIDGSSSLTADRVTGESSIEIDYSNVGTGNVLNLTNALDSSITVTSSGELPDNAEVNVDDNGNVSVKVYVAEVDGTKYTDLVTAFKAVKENSVINILDDITITEKWDRRNYNGTQYAHSTFTVPVTVNGNNHSIKFTDKIEDKNQNDAFRFEAPSVVKNLTIDMSEVVETSKYRAIATKDSITVDNCTFIGQGVGRAIIVGEGAGSNIGNVEAKITNCTFKDWGYGVTDNENGQDAKSMVVTGSSFENGGAQLSATDAVTFSGNTMENAWINITSYTKSEDIVVEVLNNNLEEDGSKVNQITTGGTITVQDDVYTPIADVDGTKYLTIAGAISSANNKTVTLVDDISVTEAIEVTNNVTIDLNGKTISAEANNGAVMLMAAGDGVVFNVADGTLTLTDSEGTGMVSTTGDAIFEVSGNGSVEITGGLYSHDVSAYAAEGYVGTQNEYGQYTVVADDSGNSKAVTDAVKVSFEKKSENKYDIVLEADSSASEIHRFLSAELNIKLATSDGSTVDIYSIDGNSTYGIEVIDPLYNDSGVWGFHLDDKAINATGNKLVIGTVTLTGYGKAALSVEAHNNNKVEAIESIDGNIVKKYVADDSSLVLPAEASKVEIKVPTKKLTIKVTFPNAIAESEKAYQDMQVKVSGKDIEDIDLELGSDGDFALNADGQYVIEIADALTLNNSYNITLTGAGYRTAKYRVTMTDDKTVYFWNDAVKGEAIAFEEGGKVKANTSFLAGDIAEDNIIDKYDLAAVVSYFGKYGLKADTELYKYAKYDLNRDGKIDSEDIAYVLASFGY